MAEPQADAHASDGDEDSRDHHNPSRGQTAVISVTRLLRELSTLTPHAQSHDRSQDVDFDLDVDTNLQGGTLQQLSTAETAKARSLFLTLHVLFPHHLLPALDLLDRGLLTKLIYGTQETAGDVSEGVHGAGQLKEASDVFYIQSSSAALSGTGRKKGPRARNTHATDPSAVYYEVRLDSWNCTCPAFAVDVASGLTRMDLGRGAMDGEHDHDHGYIAGRGENHAGEGRQGSHSVETWRFGGALTLLASGHMKNDSEDVTGLEIGPGVPVCKHILAAALARAAPALFGASVAERQATKEELAGWGGGWGELGGGL